MITDSTGTVKSRHDYLPFGEEMTANVGGRTASQGYVIDEVRQKFTGKERDTETGLDYFGARYYSNVQGRFTSTDPLFSSGHASEPQSWNRYTYIDNNPLRYIDPDGQQKKDANQALNEKFHKTGENKGSIPWVDNKGRSTTLPVRGEVGVVELSNHDTIQAGRTQLPDGSFLTNCHGYVFAQGELLIDNSQVPAILDGEGYAPVIGPVQVNDVAIYYSAPRLVTPPPVDSSMEGAPPAYVSDVVHSAIVSQIDPTTGQATQVTGFRNNLPPLGQVSTTNAGVGPDGNYPPDPNPGPNDPNADHVIYYRRGEPQR